MKNFKNKLQVFFKILICASFSTIQTNIVESKAQMIANVSDATLGIESVGSPSLRVLKLKRTVYVGECPGVRNKPTSGYFVDYETPVQPGYAVVMQNFTRGLNPNKPPTVKKDYDAGRASDKIKFKISGKSLKAGYLAMQPGVNPIKYQIIDETDRKDRKLIKSGDFMLEVKFDDTVYTRNKEYSPESGNYYCPFF